MRPKIGRLDSREEQDSDAGKKLNIRGQMETNGPKSVNIGRKRENNGSESENNGSKIEKNGSTSGRIVRKLEKSGQPVRWASMAVCWGGRFLINKLCSEKNHFHKSGFLWQL